MMTSAFVKEKKYFLELILGIFIFCLFGWVYSLYQFQIRDTLKSIPRTTFKTNNTHAVYQTSNDLILLALFSVKVKNISVLPAYVMRN